MTLTSARRDNAGPATTAINPVAVLACVLATTWMLAGCSWGKSENPIAAALEPLPGVAYTTSVAGAPSADTQALLESTLRLYTLRARPPPSLARLKRRAEADLAAAVRVLKSEGFYGAQATFTLDETVAPVAVNINLEPGVRYTLARASFSVALPDDVQLPAPAEFALAPGQPARAAVIVAAERAAVRWLRDRGFPSAKFVKRDAVADPKTFTLEVDSQLAAGERTRFGALAVTGLETVDEDYVRTYKPWRGTDWYSQREVERFTDMLNSTGLFEYARVEPPPSADAVTRLQVKEAPQRGVGGGVRLSTDGGPAGRVFLEHRNLLGANETARISATAGLFEQALRATFRKPQFLRAKQNLLASATLHHEDDNAFDELAFRARAEIERIHDARLRYSVGVTFEAADISGSNRDGKSLLFGVPLTATYDASDSLLDPTTGYRLRASVTPYAGAFDGNSVLFPVLDAHASAYWPVGEHVLAVRGRVGSIIGISRDDIPPPQRLYSGGGGSVRGYESRAIGPLDALADPLGGRSVVEVGLEARLRVTKSVGLVPFVGAGTVDDSSLPGFGDGVQYGAGLGVRYFSAVGPIRADVGFPLNPRENDDIFQWYVSIGQAF